MADRMTVEQRHRCMSHIHSKNTKPEIKVRKALFARGFRYRVNVKGLPGHPDIVLRKYSTVIYINGCFWHGHEGCKKATIPTTNTEFWKDKIKGNRERDKLNSETLTNKGWKVITIWECELVPRTFEDTMERVIAEIQDQVS